MKTNEQIVLELIRSTQKYVAYRIQDEHHKICYNGAINGIFNELKTLSFDEMRLKVDDLAKNVYAFSPNYGSRGSRWRRFINNERKYIELSFDHVRDILISIDRRFISGYHSQYIYNHFEDLGVVS